MGEHREGRGGLQIGVELAVDLGDDARDGRDAVLETIENGLLPPLAVHDIGLHHPLRRLHAAAMARQEDLVVAPHQLFQRGKEVRHVAFRRRDHRGVPAHDVIAGEHGALPDESEAEMVRRVSWRVQHVERDAAGLDRVAVLQGPVRLEGGIDEGVAEPRRPGAPAAAGRTEAQDLAAEQFLQRTRTVAMIAVAVGDKDVGDALAAGGLGDRREVVIVGWPRIDHGDMAAADEIGVGAEKGVRRRIVGDDAANLGRDVLGDAIVDISAAIEGKLGGHGLDLMVCAGSRATFS